MILGLGSTFSVGQDTFFDSHSPNSSFAVTFEDNLDTGYFYAIDTKPRIKILDTLHIYNVANVVDKEKPCKIQIWWTEDGKLASLLINDYCHAVFDFGNKAGYCRNAFPPPKRKWNNGRDTGKLTDDFISVLFEKY